jgi:hypothetical protein
LVCLATVPALGNPQAPPDAAHNEWVLATLKQMASIKAGMTEADLLQVFRLQNPNGRTHIGGVATTFISRACPYFKVDVELSDMSPSDVIVKISRPYIEHQAVID